MLGSVLVPSLSALPGLFSSSSSGVRCTHLLLDRLTAPERAALAPQLHGLFEAYYSGLSLADFSALLLEHPGVRVGLFYADGELIGCTICRCLEVTLPEETVNVLTAAVYFRPGRSGGVAAGLWGLTEALRVWLRAPWRRLGYLGMAHTPAPYVLFERVMPRVYPSPRCGEPAPRDQALMRAALSVREWAPGRGSRWVLRAPFKPADASWEAGSRLSGSPARDYFTTACPDWAEGDALAVWIPLSLTDIFRALWRLR